MPMPPRPPTIIRRLPGLTDYATVVAAMQRFTDERQPDTADEIWLLEHPPVYTLGLNTDPAHLLGTGTIPVIQTDRGGQVTYHGPGQLVVYVLIDLARARLGIRQLVTTLENAVISLAASHGISAEARREAPGVYVDGAKLASLGLRVRRGSTYHGLALNVAMDLEPFRGINPCGHAGLHVTSLAELGVTTTLPATAEALLGKLAVTLRLAG
jgi:lipoyl(octanoyl) transferase